MDPLSVIASTLTLAAAIAASLEQLRALTNASTDLQHVMDEVLEIHMVLLEIERAILTRQRYQQLPQETTGNLNKLFLGTKMKLQQLDDFLKGLLCQSNSLSGRSNAVRISWLLNKSKVRRLQKELELSRINLSVINGATNSFDLSHVLVRLNELALLQRDQAKQLDKWSTGLEHAAERSDLAKIPSMSSILPNAVGETGLVKPSGGKNMDKNELQPRTLLARRLEVHYDPLASRTEYGGSNTGPGRVRASHYRRNPCEGWCSCVCHHPHHFQTWHNADFLLGSLFVGYSGLPIKRRECNERNCRRQSIPAVRLTYYFPQWLLARALHLTLSFSYMQGPAFTLSMPRTIADNSPILFYAVQGNLKGIQSLFSQGLASPYDIGYSNGRSALHYAINYNHRELTQFLLDTGANQNLKDKNQASPVTLAWERIFGMHSQVSDEMNAWRSMFDDEEYLESRTFPKLHKIVLGLAKGDLKQELETSTSTIDDKDADGRTALSWAAAKGDLDCVKLLLEYHADCNIPSRWGHLPLQWAAQHRSERRSEVLQALLQHTANVNHADHQNRTALIAATSDFDDPECVRLLVEHGADVNWRDWTKRTALGYAAKMNRDINLKYLLSCGADPHIADHWGYTPLYEAIMHNHHEVLEILLQVEDIIPRTNFSNGNSILHVVATYGNLQTLRLMARRKIGRVDPNEHDSRGLTARTLFDQRKIEELDMEKAFRDLIGAIKSEAMDQSKTDTHYGSLIEGDDIFTDAVEYLLG